MKKVGICLTLAVVLSFTFCLSGVLAREEAGLEELDVSLGELLNLEISVATKTEMTLREAPSIVTVITGEEIKNMGARDLIDVFRTIPGIDVTHSLIYPTHKIEARGFNDAGMNNKFKMMINGHAINDGNGGIGLFFDSIPVSTIKRIEIIRGPGSALYGTGAFLAVFNIITRDGEDGASGISLEGGSYDTIKPSGELSYKSGDFKAWFYADYYKTEGYDGTIESDMATNSPVFGSSAPGEMSGDKKSHFLQTNIEFKGIHFTGFYNRFWSNNPVGIAKALTDENDFGIRISSMELGYKTGIGEKGGLRIKAWYDHTWEDTTHELFPEETAEMNIHTGFPEGESIRGGPHRKSNFVGGDMDFDYEVHSGIQFVSGISYEYLNYYDVKSVANHNVTGSDLDLNGTVYPGFPFVHFPNGMTNISENGNWMLEENRTVIAMYAQGIFNLKELFNLEKAVESLTLTSGMRYDEYDDIGSTANPRFGLVYAPFENLWFKALYGTAFRAPSLGEMYWKNNPAQNGNPNLEPEIIETLEFHAGCNLTPNITCSLTYFQIGIDDLIRQIGISFDNIGKMEAHGLETEFRINFDTQDYVYCNFTWQDVTDSSNLTLASPGNQSYSQGDFDPGNYAKYMGNIGMNYGFGKYVAANVSVNYVGEKDRSEEMVWNGGTLERKDKRDPLDDRTLVNASVTFRNFHEGVEVQLSGFNIFDSDHRDPDPDGALFYDMPQPGRWFAGKVSYAF